MEDAAEKVEKAILDTRNSAAISGLELDLIQKGLVTTLIITAVSFAVLYNTSEDKEALALAIMRCMAEALFDILGPSKKDDAGHRH